MNRRSSISHAALLAVLTCGLVPALGAAQTLSLGGNASQTVTSATTVTGVNNLLTIDAGRAVACPNSTFTRIGTWPWQGDWASGRIPHKINAQNQEMTMTGEREKVRMDSERGGVSLVRQICIAGDIAELERNHNNRFHGPTLCRESMNFSFGYAMNGRGSVHPDARNQRNELMEPYRAISGRIGRGNNDAGGMNVLNEILQKAEIDGTTNPIIISGPNGSVRISLAGVYDVGFTRTALNILNGRPLPEDVKPVSDARVNRAVELCARRIQEGNAPLSNENCTYSGDIAAATFHANPANHTNPRSRPATTR
jgi:hypothetical protein